MDKHFLYIIDALKSLPGITAKHAKTIAYFLISKDDIYINTFISRIKNVRTHLSYCEKCNNLIEDKKICDICSNKERNKQKLCIVNSSDDLNKIEQTESYNGLYYVLWEEIDAKNKKISEPVIKKLLSLVSENEIKEIIIATNWTTSGELTASYLKNLFDQVKPQINIFRLAVGLPINSAIDYADNTTLKYALINKTKY